MLPRRFDAAIRINHLSISINNKSVSRTLLVKLFISSQIGELIIY